MHSTLVYAVTRWVWSALYSDRPISPRLSSSLNGSTTSTCCNSNAVSTVCRKSINTKELKTKYSLDNKKIFGNMSANCIGLSSPSPPPPPPNSCRAESSSCQKSSPRTFGFEKMDLPSYFSSLTESSYVIPHNCCANGCANSGF